MFLADVQVALTLLYKQWRLTARIAAIAVSLLAKLYKSTREITGV